MGSRESKFIEFIGDISEIPLPSSLNNPFDYKPHLLCVIASEQLQHHLINQNNWNHNFGLSDNQPGKQIGKMFGVLVVQKEDQSIGFLAAFSGKLANKNNHEYFVPAVYDSLAEGEFLTPGMLKLKEINDKVKELKKQGNEDSNQLKQLKQHRKLHSQQLQKQLFESYQFSNSNKERKNPYEIFGSNPPAGAGECAAPKLLQYAFQNNLKPLAIAEFWWGVSPSINTESRKHKEFYPACEDKCRSVLGWMLR
ncbi:MAG: pseudouridylate synthase [Bacteroidia bacterium]|nr:pseudouridylate synthase [Bacteroidia bacterium]NNJ55972.1 pseudouridylate synthase [Bacteroidia bacterium]